MDMEGDRPLRLNWQEMDEDLLREVVKNLDASDLSWGFPQVCSSWRSVSTDPELWKTLDLSMVRSNFIRLQHKPYVYVDKPSDKALTRVLKLTLSLSRGNIMTLVFYLYTYMLDDHLIYAAERSPRLKRLVLPAWNRIKIAGMSKATEAWKELESLTISSIEDPAELLQEINRNCKNFRELKIMGPCDKSCAAAMVKYLPDLKVLSLRCSLIDKEALITILCGLKSLEKLNISHTLIYYMVYRPIQKMVFVGINNEIAELASKLPVFMTCKEIPCSMCQRVKDDEGLLRWYSYEEGLWRKDEIGSLAL